MERYERYERRQKCTNREIESLGIRRNQLIGMRKNGVRTGQTAESHPRIARETEIKCSCCKARVC